jgi:hypothetical protein
MAQHSVFTNGTQIEIVDDAASTHFHKGARGIVTGYDGQDLMVHFLSGSFKHHLEIVDSWYVNPGRCKLIEGDQP